MTCKNTILLVVNQQFASGVSKKLSGMYIPGHSGVFKELLESKASLLVDTMARAVDIDITLFWPQGGPALRANVTCSLKCKG